MSYSFHPETKAEFIEAIDYYEDCTPGLGLDFAIEIHSTIERIVVYPKAWPIVQGEIRRSQTRRFPYGVLYVESGDDICILAVMHLHRDPDYWKQRRPQRQE